jgi:hypothetical protein
LKKGELHIFSLIIKRPYSDFRNSLALVMFILDNFQGKDHALLLTTDGTAVEKCIAGGRAYLGNAL